ASSLRLAKVHIIGSTLERGLRVCKCNELRGSSGRLKAVPGSGDSGERQIMQWLSSGRYR
ncbi:hypothetical protein JYU34_016465, partial [Plutella xylostella]